MGGNILAGSTPWKSPLAEAVDTKTDNTIAFDFDVQVAEKSIATRGLEDKMVASCSADSISITGILCFGVWSVGVVRGARQLRNVASS